VVGAAKGDGNPVVGVVGAAKGDGNPVVGVVGGARRDGNPVVGVVGTGARRDGNPVVGVLGSGGPGPNPAAALADCAAKTAAHAALDFFGLVTLRARAAPNPAAAKRAAAANTALEFFFGVVGEDGAGDADPPLLI